MHKFHIVMRTRKVGLPHDLKIETSADSEGSARSNALYHLRKHGHAAFNVPPRTWQPHAREFKRFYDAHKDDAVAAVEPGDELWNRALDLRAFIPNKH